LDLYDYDVDVDIDVDVIYHSPGKEYKIVGRMDLKRLIITVISEQFSID
jgi:hypothetical protein